MSDLERALVDNTACLLTIAEYRNVNHESAAKMISEELINMSFLDKELISIMIHYARQLVGMSSRDKNIIDIIINDLVYLYRLKGE